MSGYKRVEGSDLNGKKHGQWRWFNESGGVTKVVVYSDGIEVSSSE